MYRGQDDKLLGACSINEQDRLKYLYNLDLLDTEKDQEYDNFVKIAINSTGCEDAFISLVDSDRLFFKSKEHFEESHFSTKKSLCRLAINSKQDLYEVVNIEDASYVPIEIKEDYRNWGINYYAGAPLINSEGVGIGTICVVKSSSNKLNENQAKILTTLSKQIMIHVEMQNKIKNYDNEKVKMISLFSSLSHEIRNPVTAIAGYSEKLSNDLLTKLAEKESISHMVDIYDSSSLIRNNSEYLKGLVNRVLDFAKLETGKMQPERNQTNTSLLFKQIENLTNFQAIENNVEIEVNISKFVPSSIYTDTTLVKQIAVNLLSNAIKFSKNSRVLMNVGFNYNGSFLTLDVIDQGIGISEEEQLFLFHPFEQASSSTKRNFKGTGLGLYICKQISTILNGEISLVSSTLSEGSHFRCRINVGIERDYCSLDQLEDGLNDFDLSTLKKILVIDDQKENLHLFKYYLKDHPIEIHTCMDEIDFSRLIKENNYCVVFMDINIGNLSGFELIKKFSTDSGKQKVIAFSATCDEREITQFKDAGFFSHLNKPFDLSRIKESLR